MPPAGPAPKASVSFDRIADRYDETRGGEVRGRGHADALAPWVLPDGPLLEVGVGTGVVAAALHGRGISVAGVDLSLAMLRRARDRLGARVVAGDALRLPVRTGAVATVCFVHVLHLVGD